MAESVQELLDYINSAANWHPHEDEVVEVAPSVFPEPDIEDFAMPVISVRYYPICDCGEPLLFEKVLMCKEPTMYGYRYMDTCYECQVVSSD